jgi:hypothetical protein
MNDGSTILFDKTVPFPMEKKRKRKLSQAEKETASRNN